MSFFIWSPLSLPFAATADCCNLFSLVVEFTLMTNELCVCECTATGWQLWCTHVLYYILYICVRVRSMEIRFIRVRSSHYVRHIDYYIIEYRVMATIAWCGLYGVGELNCQIHASSNGHSLEIKRWTWQRQQQRVPLQMIILDGNMQNKKQWQPTRRVKETMRNETSVFC